MKPYGLPRIFDVEHPDIINVHIFGFNSSRSGKDYFKNKSTKRAIRRYWKKRERMNQKKYLNELE